MKRLVVVLFLFTVLTAELIAQPSARYFVIAMTKTRFDNPAVYNACGKILARIQFNLATNVTPSAAQISKAMSTWVWDWRYVPDTNIVIAVYSESAENLRGGVDNTTPAQRAAWRQYIKDDPQINADWTRNPTALLRSWNLESKSGRTGP